MEDGEEHDHRGNLLHTELQMVSQNHQRLVAWAALTERQVHVPPPDLQLLLQNPLSNYQSLGKPSRLRAPLQQLLLRYAGLVVG